MTKKTVQGQAFASAPSKGLLDTSLIERVELNLLELESIRAGTEQLIIERVKYINETNEMISALERGIETIDRKRIELQCDLDFLKSKKHAET
jgi:hypothetical protein